MHIFADLRHNHAWPRNASKLLDSCSFWQAGAANPAPLQTAPVVTMLFDNPVRTPGKIVPQANADANAEGC